MSGNRQCDDEFDVICWRCSFVSIGIIHSLVNWRSMIEMNPYLDRVQEVAIGSHTALIHDHLQFYRQRHRLTPTLWRARYVFSRREWHLICHWPTPPAVPMLSLRW